ncbi:MAG: hypothetical protein OXK20_08185 [Deltaproteobacteria bacterium]|nr:hypothetical protein [Deltaproteobacteria bacterium]
MTEFETAALVYQAASLSYQYAALWVSGGVGAAQCLLIGSGLWLMHRGMQRRDRQHAETIAAQERHHAEHLANHAEYMANHAQLMANHEETMKVLNANVLALEQQGEALREQGAALREQGAALRVVVERTGSGHKN